MIPTLISLCSWSASSGFRGRLLHHAAFPPSNISLLFFQPHQPHQPGCSIQWNEISDWILIKIPPNFAFSFTISSLFSCLFFSPRSQVKISPKAKAVQRDKHKETWQVKSWIKTQKVTSGRSIHQSTVLSTVVLLLQQSFPLLLFINASLMSLSWGSEALRSEFWKVWGRTGGIPFCCPLGRFSVVPVGTIKRDVKLVFSSCEVSAQKRRKKKVF